MICENNKCLFFEVHYPVWFCLHVLGSCTNPLMLSVSISTISFNTLELCTLPTEYICMLRIVFTVNGDFFPEHHYPDDLCSGDVRCFLWGTNWIRIYYLEEIRCYEGYWCMCKMNLILVLYTAPFPAVLAPEARFWSNASLIKSAICIYFFVYLQGT
jgi:hypothetical protein